MLQTTIGDVLDKFVDTTGYRLYLIRNSEKEVIYVGQSTNFYKRLRAHITTRDAAWEGLLGKTIYNHMPSSREWRVELYTIDDCSSLINTWFPVNAITPDNEVKYAEDALIHQFNPAYNRTINMGWGISSPFTERIAEEIRERELERDQEFARKEQEFARKREYLVNNVCNICDEHDRWVSASDGAPCGLMERSHGFELICHDCARVIDLLKELGEKADRVHKVEKAYAQRRKLNLDDNAVDKLSFLSRKESKL